MARKVAWMVFAALSVAGAAPAAAQLRVEPRIGMTSDVAMTDVFNFDAVGEMTYAALIAQGPLAGDGRSLRSPERWRGRTLGVRVTESRPGRYDRGGALVLTRAETSRGRSLGRLDVLGLARGWAGRSLYVEGGFGLSRTARGDDARWHALFAPKLGVVVPVMRGFGVDVAAGAEYRWAPWRGDYVGYSVGFGVVALPRR